jgi:predicted dehydrogenase
VEKKKEHKVVVLFLLRLTPWAKKVKEIIDSGVLGKIEHVQAVNNAAVQGNEDLVNHYQQ